MSENIVWLSVNFSPRGSNDPGSILGVFDSRESAMGRLKSFWEDDLDNMSFVDTDGNTTAYCGKGRRAEEVAQVFSMTMNDHTDIGI